MGGPGTEDEWEENVIAHPVQPRAVIPMLPPVLVSITSNGKPAPITCVN
jgi:hypothetical protein